MERLHTIRTVCFAAAGYLTDDHRWTRGASARNYLGKTVPRDHPQVVRRDAAGWIYVASRDLIPDEQDRSSVAIEIACRVLDTYGRAIGDFNDDDGREASIRVLREVGYSFK